MCNERRGVFPKPHEKCYKQWSKSPKQPHDDAQWRKRIGLHNPSSSGGGILPGYASLNFNGSLAHKVFALALALGLLSELIIGVDAKPQLHRKPKPQVHPKSKLGTAPHPPGYMQDQFGVGQRRGGGTISLAEREEAYGHSCTKPDFITTANKPSGRIDVRLGGSGTGFLPRCYFESRGCGQKDVDDFNTFVTETKEKTNAIVTESRQEVLTNPESYVQKLRGFQWEIQEKIKNSPGKSDLTPEVIDEYALGLLFADKAKEKGYGNCYELAYYAVGELSKLKIAPKKIQIVSFDMPGEADHVMVLIDSNLKDGKITGSSDALLRYWEGLTNGYICDMWNDSFFSEVKRAKETYNMYSSEFVSKKCKSVEVVTLI